MSDKRPVIYHLGRSGEVAGGMTQVINGYLEWPFERVDVRVIVSRGDPGDTMSSMKRLVNAACKVIALDRRRQNVVVAHLSEGGSFLREGGLLRLAHARGIPTIAHLHGAAFAEFAQDNPGRVGPVLAASDRVITLSQESSDVAARFVDPERIVLIPNAIAPASPVVKERTVVFGGAVGYRKGIDMLQEAWGQIDGAAPEWRLIIAGPVIDAQLIDPLLPGVEFVGAVDHSELMRLLDSAAIAVLPSREEAMPMFILEAMARQCAVVSTDVGGIAAVLADGAGVVIPPGDSPALRRALFELMSDDVARAAVAATGRRVFDERFSATAVFPRVEQIWCEVAEKSARRRGKTGDRMATVA